MSEKQKGIIFIILSAFLFALMNLFVKLTGDIPPIQKAFFRNSGAFVIALVVILKHKKKHTFANKKLSFTNSSCFIWHCWDNLQFLCSYNVTTF